MPEGPELRLMAKYINQVSRDKEFTHISKSEVSKYPQPTAVPERFTLTAKTRGKELRITLDSGLQIYFTMGMTGNWFHTPPDQLEKHSHLLFHTPDSILSFVDPRRFGSWRIDTAWQPYRGPDILDETETFKENLSLNLHKKIFDKPLYEVFMDQRYFNGIGNYLRAEIIDRLAIDPQMPARDIVLEDTFIEMCVTVQEESYALGGGELRSFIDPNKPYKEKGGEFRAWLQCYEKKSKILDKKKRTFWYDPKWNLEK